MFGCEKHGWPEFCSCHKIKQKYVIYISEATGLESWTLFSHVLVMQWDLEMFGDFLIFATGTVEVDFIFFCRSQNKCVQILSPRLFELWWRNHSENFKPIIEFFYNSSFPAKSWQDPASIDIQWSPPIECECWKDPAMIWQVMSNCRKTRLFHRTLVKEIICGDFFA